MSAVKTLLDLLHVVLLQVMDDFFKARLLENLGGWVGVDQRTMRHGQCPDRSSLGDMRSAPNARSAASVLKHIVSVAENLTALRAGTMLPSVYDGHGSSPLAVEIGKVTLAIFDRGDKLLPTFPISSMIARRSAPLLKKIILTTISWNAVLKGRERLAQFAQVMMTRDPVHVR